MGFFEENLVYSMMMSDIPIRPQHGRVPGTGIFTGNVPL